MDQQPNHANANLDSLSFQEQNVILRLQLNASQRNEMGLKNRIVVLMEAERRALQQAKELEAKKVELREMAQQRDQLTAEKQVADSLLEHLQKTVMGLLQQIHVLQQAGNGNEVPDVLAEEMEMLKRSLEAKQAQQNAVIDGAIKSFEELGKRVSGFLESHVPGTGNSEKKLAEPEIAHPTTSEPTTSQKKGNWRTKKIERQCERVEKWKATLAKKAMTQSDE